MPLRYITDFDTTKIQSKYFDVVIQGSGIAGLSAAIALDPTLCVCVLSKETLEDNNSSLAQGGIAAAIGEDDMPQYHYEDTIKAGAGHCNSEAVRILVEEAPYDIEMLCKIGTNFDRNIDGTLTTTREGGHRRFRVVHALGDATGREVVHSLLRECMKRDNIHIIENCFAIDLLTENNTCYGIILKIDNEPCTIYCKKMICASGGIGQLYKNTTNLEVATGDGIAMAYRAGATLCDMEFVQFHPTALYNINGNDKGSRFLISEAVRGEGGILKNIKGERFMPKYHEMAEIAPRDTVSRAIFNEMKLTESDFVYLDITHKDSDYIKKRFPTIYEKCLTIGIDITKDYITVSPVQHYFMGGISTDLWGKTTISNFYACGEAANTGVHGANRLASNSLLEGLVFGRRAAFDINNCIKDYTFKKLDFINITDKKDPIVDIESIQTDIKNTMEKYAGIIRTESEMSEALLKINNYMELFEQNKVKTQIEMETINMICVASQILKSAINRKESLGSHYRID